MAGDVPVARAGGEVDVEPALAPVGLPTRAAMKESPALRAQLDAAYGAFRRAVDDGVASPKQQAAAYGEVGTILFAARYWTAAEPYLRNAETLAPGERRWPYYLGHLYRMQGDVPRAAARFARVVALEADDAPALFWLGEMRLLEGAVESAETRFTQVLALRPRSVAARFALGRVALARDDLDEAVDHFEQALVLDPDAGAVHYALAQVYRRRGDSARAEPHLMHRGSAAIEPVDPLMREIDGLVKSPLAYETRGSRALEAGDFEGAVTSFRQGIALAPDDPGLRHKLGTALFLSGDTEAGLQILEDTVAQAPTYAKAQYSLGVLMATSGRTDEAIDRFVAAVRDDPTYVEARGVLADLLRHSGRPAEAAAQYERILEIDPRAVDAWFGRAMLRVGGGDYSGAVRLLTEARTVEPGDVRVVHALVRVLAAAPESTVRDGARAMALLEGLGDADRGLDPEAVAMALAEVGAFLDAVAWQREAIAAAERAGRSELARRMTGNLELYQDERPCRVPWRPGELP